MNGSTTPTGRALIVARARLLSAARLIGPSQPGLDQFARRVSALVSAARTFEKAESEHDEAMRQHDERTVAELERRAKVAG